MFDGEGVGGSMAIIWDLANCKYRCPSAAAQARAKRVAAEDQQCSEDSMVSPKLEINR